ncbi:hypothetical protein VD0002_g7489 [Verticillium dahliae]|nr:hypothetical protein VdG2_07039 [Verticillium dahliae VDG2]KAH6703575.1 hypothetical protein EV126DRAFT_210115 [Verticillium dahliae]PNH28220.1 hypothetical protein BJF96_g8486 [Verticillium dahliae]PNH54003.1 hypothetical protein VD0003_g3451 [Verticillium dahliae]PNH60108.1 hypothetical protein VD0002_g7489 [Verticillium dahliae]
MSATAAYRQFLASPNSALLAANATLHYITTTSTFNGPTDIIKHLSTQRNQLKKHQEDILDVVEGRDALAAEIETALEFVTSGGAYLPGLDDNFLADQKVYFTITHFVTFDAEGKITQIRLTWDQGSLLKQLEIIGKSGRNWPIRDGKEQTKLITTALKASGRIASAPDTNEITIRSRRASQNILRDPHASLSLFASREQQAADETNGQSVVSPYAGTRPHQRSFTDILTDAPAEDPSSPSAGRERAPKIGAGKNFQPQRLFDADPNAPLEPESPEATMSPSKAYRPHPTKYNHFDFADGSDPQDAAAAVAARDAHKPKPAKNGANWSFEDFTTPHKPQPSKAFRHQDVRHWDADKDSGIQETPVHHAPPKPRRDAEAHFEYLDDGLPQPGSRVSGRPRGAGQNEGSHLYENNLYNEDGSAPTPAPNRALGNITNLSDRHKDFDPHFAIEDKSPAPSKVQKPAEEAKKENAGGIHIAGDGMGGRKGTNRDWLYGEDSEPTPKANNGKKQGTSGAQKNSSFNWDF